MKKKWLLPLLILLAPLSSYADMFCSTVVPEHFWYLSGGFSLGCHGDTETTDFCAEHKLGFGGTGALGVKWCDWRFELEGSKRRFRNDDLTLNGSDMGSCGHIKHVALMLNGYYDYCLSPCFDLYGGFGIGLDRAEVNTGDFVGSKDADTVFAYQAKLGVAYKLSHAWQTYVGYTFFATTKPTFFDKKTKDIPYSNNIDLGLRVFF